MKTIRLHQGDLPNLSHYSGISSVAIDTETMGLHLHRDRLCVVQLSPGDGSVDIVQISEGQKNAPHISHLLEDPAITKLFHYARFDMAILFHSFGIMPQPVFCTKIASRLVRTYSNKHGLQEICGELLGVSLSKEQQSSDWGEAVLTNAQQHYAASDVLYLHHLQEKLTQKLQRNHRTHLAQACFSFLPTRVELDLAGWQDQDIFSHS